MCFCFLLLHNISLTWRVKIFSKAWIMMHFVMNYDALEFARLLKKTKTHSSFQSRTFYHCKICFCFLLLHNISLTLREKIFNKAWIMMHFCYDALEFAHFLKKTKTYSSFQSLYIFNLYENVKIKSFVSLLFIIAKCVLFSVITQYKFNLKSKDFEQSVSLLNT